MTDIAIRRLFATACIFVIVALGLFIATQAYKMYGSSDSLDRQLSEHKRLVDQLKRHYK